MDGGLPVGQAVLVVGHTHFLSHQICGMILSFLSEYNREDGVRATTCFIHVCSSYRPANSNLEWPWAVVSMDMYSL